MKVKKYNCKFSSFLRNSKTQDNVIPLLTCCDLRREQSVLWHFPAQVAPGQDTK